MPSGASDTSLHLRTRRVADDRRPHFRTRVRLASKLVMLILGEDIEMIVQSGQVIGEKTARAAMSHGLFPLCARVAPLVVVVPAGT
jgi:hypothetical protein